MESAKPEPGAEDRAVQGTRSPDVEAARRSGGGEVNGWLLVVLGLLLIGFVVLLPGAANRSSAASKASAPGTLSAVTLSFSVSNAYSSTLPMILQAPPTPTPAVSPVDDPIVYDCDGEISTVYWLTTTFGALTWSQSESIPLSALHARCRDQPATIIAHVEDSNGKPLENITVVFHWPDAPSLPLELHNCGLDRGVYGTTNLDGDIGFGIGPGAYYFPPAAGPHTLWLPGGACLAGLGMLGETNHEHVDGDWTVSGQERADSPELYGWGFSPQCPAYLENVSGREMWVVRCGE